MRAIQIFVWDWAASLNMLFGCLVVIVSLTLAGMSWGAPGTPKLIVVLASLQVPIVALEICFGARRLFGELKEMMGSGTPAQLVLATYAAILSMSLFIVNAAGWVLRDPPFLFYLNAGVLLMTTICTAAAVVSRWHDAPLISWFAGIFVAYQLMEHDLFPWLTANPTAASICALSVIPAIIYGSLLVFESSVQNGTLEQKGYR